MDEMRNKKGLAIHLLLDYEMAERRLREFVEDLLLENNNIIKKPKDCKKVSLFTVWDEDNMVNTINVESLEMVDGIIHVHGISLVYHAYNEQMYDIIKILLDWGVIEHQKYDVSYPGGCPHEATSVCVLGVGGGCSHCSLNH